LTDFFISILEAPLLAQEQTEAISALSEQQAVTSGVIDPFLKPLKKVEVLKLLKEAGLTKGRAAEFQKMTVNKLKVLYTEHLQKTRTTRQSRAEAFGFLSQLGERQKQEEAEEAALEQRNRELKIMRQEEKSSRTVPLLP
jgi:YesN/AraC family two-component response regulator